MIKIGIFSEIFSIDDADDNIKMMRMGMNTGNIMFMRSLKKHLNPVFIKPYSGVHNCIPEKLICDKYITTDLIWIRPDVEYPNTEKILKNIGDKPLIPISVGLQANQFGKFKLHPNTEKLLKSIQERAIIGVRGYYTAEILNSYGITNISVIGCPSVYYIDNYSSLVNKKTVAKNIRTVLNFKTFWGKINNYECNLLKFGCINNASFVEQTIHSPKAEMFDDVNEFNKLIPWLKSNTKLFYKYEDWDNFIKNFDLSIGMRFHGNIVAIQNGVPSLFIPSDSRTRELTDFFKLPAIMLQDFNPELSPEHYRDMTDYSEFNRNYADKYDCFKEFLVKNQLIM